MQTFASIIDDLGGGAVVAHAIGEQPGTVRQWKGRDSIPADRWPKIVQLATEKGIEGVTAASLAEIAASKKAAADAEPPADQHEAA